MLHAVFEYQSRKWEPMALHHLSKAIVIVHDYIFRLVSYLCPEEQVRVQLWHGLLLDKLSSLYRKAMDHGRFLLDMERGQPTTFNPHFSNVLHRKRAKRLSSSLTKMAETRKLVYTKNQSVSWHTNMEQLQQAIVKRSNDDQVCEDVFDTFVSYYKVARKRFVDVLYQQAISHYLLLGPDSPLKTLDPDMVMRLSDKQLEAIAGEDEESKQRRAVLDREMSSLKDALKVLRA